MVVLFLSYSMSLGGVGGLGCVAVALQSIYIFTLNILK